MARYTQPTGREKKYRQTDPVYGTFDKDEVDAGIVAGTFVLMERAVYAKVNGRMQSRPDRRYMPADKVEAKKAKGYRVVEQSGAERSASIPARKVTKS